MNDFTQPQTYTLEKYKEHCVLLPLDFYFQISSFKKISAKQYKKDFFQRMIKSSQSDNPEMSKEEHLARVQNNFLNMMVVVRENLKEQPLLSLAYPIANCWIVVFYASFFDKSKKIFDIPQEIVKSNYDPVVYSFKNFKG